MRGSKVFTLQQTKEAMLGRLMQPPGEVPLFTQRRVVDAAVSPTVASKPFVIVLRLLGCLPITVQQQGKVSFKLFSPTMAYSLAVYVLVVFLIYFELSRKLVFGSGKIDKVVDIVTQVTFFMKSVLIPAILWLPIRRVVNHQSSWTHFHENYIRLTGEVIRFDQLGKVTPFFAFAIPVVALALAGLWTVIITTAEVWLVALYALPTVISLALDGLWCTNYIMIGLTAVKINQQLKKHLARYSGDAGVQEVLVREYRGLYLEVSRLLQSNNDVSTVTFTYHTGHVFLMLTLSLYAVLSGLREDWSWLQSVRLVCTLLYLAELWALANAAHFTTAKFDEIQWDADWLIPADSMPEGVRKEITTLLEVAAASPRVVDIGGFVTINRSWLTNMLGNLLSSLIILLQFRVSQTEVAATPAP